MTIPAWVTKTGSFVLLGAIVIAGFLYKPTAIAPAYIHPMSVSGVPVQAAFAVSKEEQARGLSGTRSLAADQGMLFFFNEPTIPSFWMKDMHYPLDMIWIGADKHIVDITLGAEPKSYPKTFSPGSLSQYVLEVPAGFVQAHALWIGAEVSF